MDKKEIDNKTKLLNLSKELFDKHGDLIIYFVRKPGGKEESVLLSTLIKELEEELEEL